MRSPFSVHNEIPVSSNVWSSQTIQLVRARTVSITVSVTYPAAAAVDSLVNVYYSPDGNKWDTLPYATFGITVTAASTVQRTVILDCPEHGYIRVRFYNVSAAHVVTTVIMWYTIQSWDAIGSNLNERIMEKEIIREEIEETGQRER
jgi:hypothetical protein